MPIEPGQILDNKYRVVRRIGEGGMGTVYEGVNVRIERRVAIKVLHEQVASLPEFAQRFEREARAAGRIGSPHVCDVLDLGDMENGDRYIVMEFLDGASLEDRIAQGPMSPDDLAPIAFEILEGLGTMHHAGVIHRDLKPANVFLARMPNRRRDVVKILDFGIAKIQPLANDPAQMTSTGMMMGTPLYMSPEQARGAREVDGRSDLYSASVIFYRALSGELPYSAANLNELLFKIVLEEPRHVREVRADLDEEFAAIVMKGLSRERDNRYASAREYQEAIAAWGKARGRSSLAFTISLPSTPPPPPATATGPVTPVGPAGPSGTVALPSQAAVPAAASTAPGTPPGTPVAWSGNPHALADDRTALAGGGGEERVTPPPRTPPPPAPAGTSARPPPSRAPLFAAAAAIAVVAGGGLVVRARFAGETKTSPPASAEATASATSEPVPVVTPPPTTSVAATASSTPSAEATASATSEPVPVVTPPPTTSVAATASSTPSAEPSAEPPSAKAAPVATTVKRDGPRGASTAAGSASVPQASANASASAGPAPTSTSGRRKFRTDLD